jgi:hypothetical protein
LSDLNPAVQIILSGLEPEKTGDEAIEAFGSFIDARDCAEIHVLALTEEAAGSERILTCAGKIDTKLHMNCTLFDLDFFVRPRKLLMARRLRCPPRGTSI